MRVKVKTLVGQIHTVDIKSEETVEQLKEKLCQQVKIPLTGQKLVYAGRILNNGTLAEV